MDQIVKQSLGIDCSKKDFAVTFSVCDAQHEVVHCGSRTFLNAPIGFKGLDKWLSQYHNPNIPLICVIEATGVYHEALVHYLDEAGYQVSVVLPKRAKDFSRTVKVKKVTDKIASQYLAVMGLEKKLEIWSKPEVLYLRLRRLHREKERIQDNITQLKCQLEAEQQSYYTDTKAVHRINETLILLKSQRKEVILEIQAIVNEHPHLKERIDKLCSIPGIGLLTASAIVGETNGFKDIRNQRQLVSYAGYDIMNHESGTSVRTKPRISKRGNKHIRKAMHMPALASIRHNSQLRALYHRIVARTGIKMKGVVAVQRKLLILLYTLWIKEELYDIGYAKKEGSTKLPHELDLVRSC